MAEQLVFSMEDPVGDDDGPGTYVYPTNPVFVDGVFDIIRFDVYYDDGWVVFKIYFRELGGNPWNGENGFSLQYIHIYVCTTLDIPPNTMSLGLNIRIEPGWHFAVLVNGGWNPGSGPVPQGEEPAIYYYNGSTRTWGEYFRITTDSVNNAVVIRIYRSLLLDVEHMGSWGYALIITSYDGYNTEGYRIRSFELQATEWTIGGVDPDALEAGVEPRVLDVLANTLDKQYEMLNSYDPRNGLLAVVYIVFPENPVQITLTTSSEITTSPVTSSTTETTTYTTPYTVSTSQTILSTTTTTVSSPLETTITPTSSPQQPPIIPTTSYSGGENIFQNALIVVYLALIASAIIVIIVFIKIMRT